MDVKKHNMKKEKTYHEKTIKDQLFYCCFRNCSDGFPIFQICVENYL